MSLFLGLKTISVALRTKHIDSTWAYIYSLRIIVMISRKVGWVCWIIHYVHGNKIDGLKLLKEINGLFFSQVKTLTKRGKKRERKREIKIGDQELSKEDSLFSKGHLKHNEEPILLVY